MTKASLTSPDTYPSGLSVRGLRHEFFTLMLGRSRGSSGRLPFLTPCVSYSGDIYAPRASFPSPLHHCWVRLFVPALNQRGRSIALLHLGLDLFPSRRSATCVRFRSLVSYLTSFTALALRLQPFQCPALSSFAASLSESSSTGAVWFPTPVRF